VVRSRCPPVLEILYGFGSCFSKMGTKQMMSEPDAEPAGNRKDHLPGFNTAMSKVRQRVWRIPHDGLREFRCLRDQSCLFV